MLSHRNQHPILMGYNSYITKKYIFGIKKELLFFLGLETTKSSIEQAICLI